MCSPSSSQARIPLAACSTGNDRAWIGNPDLPENTMDAAEKWAAGISGPAYAIDDETAIKVVDGTVEVVSEVHWKLFSR